MPLNVVCPGCFKRFQVSDRFAGQKGPCPNCSVIIEIPLANVTMQDDGALEYGGRTRTGKLVLKPLERIVPDFNPQDALWYGIATGCIFLVAVLVGLTAVSTGTRTIIATLGLLITAFPLSLFGYQVLRQRDQLFLYTGQDLFIRTALTALGYCIVWIVIEFFFQWMHLTGTPTVFYLLIFAALAMFISYTILDLTLGNAFLHFFVFAVPVLLLRRAIGLGWLWEIQETIINNPNTPLPPFWN